MSMPCKNIDVMSSICNLTKRFCIHCAGYEARETPKEMPKEMPKEVTIDNNETTTTDKKAVVFKKGGK